MSQRVSRMVGEFAVIVLGVLVALGLESTWQARQDRVREAELIQDLTGEFRANRDRLLADIERNAALFATAQALEALPPSSPVPGDLGGSFGIQRFEPLDGVLQSTIQTGDLGLLLDPTLRAGLAGWPARVREAERTAIDNQATRASILPQLLDVIVRPTTDGRRQLFLGWFRGLGNRPLQQQQELLRELHRILVLLEEAGA